MGSNIPCAAPPHIVSTVFFESRLEHGTGLEVGHAVAVHGFYGALPGHAVEHQWNIVKTQKKPGVHKGPSNRLTLSSSLNRHTQAASK